MKLEECFWWPVLATGIVCTPNKRLSSLIGLCCVWWQRRTTRRGNVMKQPWKRPPSSWAGSHQLWRNHICLTKPSSFAVSVDLVPVSRCPPELWMPGSTVQVVGTHKSAKRWKKIELTLAGGQLLVFTGETPRKAKFWLEGIQRLQPALKPQLWFEIR